MNNIELKRGDVIVINWNNHNVFAIFDKFDKTYGNCDALFIYAEMDMLTDELYFKPKDCEFSYELNDITYRLATEDEKNTLYNAIGKYFTEEYDKDWYNHFTDSSYFDIQDFLLDMFCINLDDYDNDLTSLKFVDIIHNYIWNKLCEVMGCKECDGDEFVEQLVNMQEFIAKLKKWLMMNTNWDMEYDEEGRNPNYGTIDELIKYMEE